MTREQRLERIGRQSHWLDARIARVDRLCARLSWLRLFIAAAGLIAAVAVLLGAGPRPALIVSAVAVVVFAAIVAFQRRLERSMERHAALLRLREQQAARLELRWSELPPHDPEPAPPDHPFAVDLDLVGERSVARLIDRTCTVDGSRRLRSWLLAIEPDMEAVAARRALVAELVSRRRLRDRMVVAASHGAMATQLTGAGPGRADPRAALGWLLEPTEGQRDPTAAAMPQSGAGTSEAVAVDVPVAQANAGISEAVALDAAVARPDVDPSEAANSAEPAGRPSPWRFLRRPEVWALLLGALATVNALLYVLGRLELVAIDAWQAPWLLYAFLVVLTVRLAGDAHGEAVRLETALRRLSDVLSVLENHDPRGAPALAAVLEPVHAARQRPSLMLRRVVIILSASSVRGNPLAWLLVHAFLPWDLIFASWLGSLRGRLRTVVPAWLDAWHELEAADSLADLMHLDSGWTMPRIGGPNDGRRLIARDELLAACGLGHPLLPAEDRVRNDISLSVGEMALVTGSNMSGKSTFLRALGVATAMAQAGGPVDARSLDIAPVRLRAVVRVDDSVTDGISFFYGEVRRLAALLRAVQEPGARPVLFLVDEIFRGTNNRERLIGGRAYLRALAGAVATGLVATHDLELCALGDELQGVRNLHFRDDIAGERMIFDYKLRPGPCPTTNALRIMRAAGLPVPEDRSQ